MVTSSILLVADCLFMQVEAVTQRAAAWEESLQQRAFQAEDAVSHAAVDARLQLGAVQLGSLQLQRLLDADRAEQPGPSIEPLGDAEHLLDTLPDASRCNIVYEYSAKCHQTRVANSHPAPQFAVLCDASNTMAGSTCPLARSDSCICRLHSTFWNKSHMSQ